MEGQTACSSDMIIRQWLLGRLVTGRPRDVPFTVTTGNKAISRTCSGQSCLLCRSCTLPHSSSTLAQGTSHKQPCQQRWDHRRGQQPGLLCPGPIWPWPHLSVPPANTGSQGRMLHMMLLLRGETQPHLEYRLYEQFHRGEAVVCPHRRSKYLSPTLPMKCVLTSSLVDVQKVHLIDRLSQDHCLILRDFGSGFSGLPIAQKQLA